MCRIMTVSGVYMSLRAKTGVLPLRSQERNGESFEFLPGGRGTVTAAALSALGADSVLCAKIANDANGKILSEFFSAANVSLRYSEKAKTCKTGYQLTLFESDGSWRIIKFPGANRALDKDDVELAFSCMPDAVFLQNEVPDDILIETCRIAREKEIPVFYQPCAKRGNFSPLDLGELEMLILDSSEVFSYCGVEMTDVDKCLQACIALSSCVTAKYYVIRLGGERGTFIYDGKYHYIVEPYGNDDTVDIGGAFEIFGAAIATYYMKTKNFRQSVVYGNVAYAISEEREGDVDSIPTHGEIERYIKKNEIDV